jgi:hypothetical protein
LGDQTGKIMSLRPVSFTLKNDPQERNQFGLIAEEVAKIYPELVIYDKEGHVYTLNYMNLIPLLLAQIQLLEQKSQDYELKLARLEGIIERLAAVNNLF